MHLILLFGISLIVIHLFIQERTMLINGEVGPWTRRIRAFRRWSPVIFFAILIPILSLIAYVVLSVFWALIF